MSVQPRIVALAGSLRGESYNKKLVQLAAAAARAAGGDVTYVDLRDYPLPIFDEDLEKSAGPPGNATKLKALFIPAQGLIFACPEYNSGITAVLKNTIDWLSRPAAGEGALAAFRGKVAGLLAASPGALGGLRGLVGVRSILSNIGVLVLPDQVAVMKAHEAFGADGRLSDAKQQGLVEGIGRQVVETARKLLG